MLTETAHWRDLCEEKTYTIIALIQEADGTIVGPTEVEETGLTYGPMALRRLQQDRQFVHIIHMPSGGTFASCGFFASEDQAGPAMIELARLRNNWLISAEEGEAMRPQVEEIFRRHGAIIDIDILKRNITSRDMRETMARRLNGYTDED